MKFSERLQLAKEYEEWLQEHPQVKDCPLSVLSFLEIKKQLLFSTDIFIEKVVNIMERELNHQLFFSECGCCSSRRICGTCLKNRAIAIARREAVNATSISE